MSRRYFREASHLLLPHLYQLVVVLLIRVLLAHDLFGQQLVYDGPVYPQIPHLVASGLLDHLRRGVLLSAHVVRGSVLFGDEVVGDFAGADSLMGGAVPKSLSILNCLMLGKSLSKQTASSKSMSLMPPSEVMVMF